MTGFGVAVARHERRWAYGFAGLVLLFTLNMGRLSGHLGGGLLVVAVYGLVPVAIGYWLAAPVDPDQRG